MLPFALHGYCTSVHTSTEATPPPSPSIQHEGSASHGRSESRQRKFQWKLSLIEFKSVTAVCHGHLYQKVEASSTKEARPHECQESGLVLKVILSDLNRFQGK